MASSDNRAITLISCSAPYNGSNARMALDAAMATAVFDKPVNFIFLGDGVLQLLKHQDGGLEYTKTIGNMITALDLYGIETLWVEEESLDKRGLAQSDLVANAKPATSEQIQTLINESVAVVNL